jgi:hypothetical protein
MQRPKRFYYRGPGGLGTEKYSIELRLKASPLFTKFQSARLSPNTNSFIFLLPGKIASSLWRYLQ